MSRADDVAKVRWEVEDTKSGFRHRVVKGTCAGPWASYAGIAMLTYRATTYFAVTRFYEGTFPVETPFQIKAAI